MQHRRPSILFAYLWFCFADFGSATAQTFEAASVKPVAQATVVRVRPSQSGGPGSSDPTHRESKETALYQLVVGKNGPTFLTEAKKPEGERGTAPTDMLA